MSTDAISETVSDRRTTMDKPQEISLLDSLQGEWIKLPLPIMREVGPAVQTLGGLLKITKRETFSAVQKIGGAARVPVATARKHLAILEAAGYVANKGREHTRNGWLRRTATLRITKKTKHNMTPYGFLPWWACCKFRKVGKLPWSAKVVLSVVMARLCGLARAVADGTQVVDPEDYYEDDVDEIDLVGEKEEAFLERANAWARSVNEDEFVGEIENFGGDERFRFSLGKLIATTGLAEHSVIEAKRKLSQWGIIRWYGQGAPARGESRDTRRDILAPSWTFRIVETPASPGRCYLGLRGPAKVGRGACKTGQ